MHSLHYAIVLQNDEYHSFELLKLLFQIQNGDIEPLLFQPLV